MSTNRKGQAWYIDFGVSLMIFIFTLVFYYGYTNNYQGSENSKTDELASEARLISSSLMQSGYPLGWNNETAVRLGIADNHVLNATKLSYFSKVNYQKSKSLLGTRYEFFVFFEDSHANVLSINGLCGVGHNSVEISYNISSAYYYSDISNSFMMEHMQSVLNSDVFYGDDASDLNDIDGLISNISKYDIVMLEHPDIPAAKIPGFKSAIESYLSYGGAAVMSGQITPANDASFLGMDFGKKASQLPSDREATVLSTEPHTSLNLGQSITFTQAYYAQSPSPGNELQIAAFDLGIDSAILKWQYGNGTAYFFSDFGTDAFDGNLSQTAVESSLGPLQGRCNPIGLLALNYDNLVKNERYLNYRSSLIKMKLYVWE
jgi:hypothetical protein